MKINIQKYAKFFFIAVITISIISFFNASDASAKHKKGKHSKSSSKKGSKRHYNPELTRAQALEIMSGSEELSNLAGIEPNTTSPATDATQVTPQVQAKDAFYEPGEDPDELAQEDDVTVDMDSFRTLWSTAVDGSSEGDDETSSGIAKKDIMGTIMDWLGTPYHFGGLSDHGIDCSAFVQRVYLLTAQVHLPRTAQEQFSIGKPIRRTELQFGDMIFFHTRRAVYASHVGIYLGDNLFAHASSRYGVTVSSLESTYYDKRFIGARRLSSTDVSRMGMK